MIIKWACKCGYKYVMGYSTASQPGDTLTCPMCNQKDGLMADKQVADVWHCEACHLERPIGLVEDIPVGVAIYCPACNNQTFIAQEKKDG